jgi:hypothetical protein
MLQALVMILVFGVLNRLRGWEWGKPYTSKGMTSAVSGAVAGGCAFWLGYGPVVSGLIAMVVFLGVWIWSIRGWGRFFSSFGGHDTRHEQESAWIDRMGIAVFPEGDYWSNRKRGTLEMALRGLYLVPLFLVLSVCAWKWSVLLGLGGLLQGPVYFATGIVPETWRVPLAEAAWGGVMGFMVWLSLWMGA